MQIEGRPTPVATLALHLMAFAVPIRARRVELGACDSPAYGRGYIYRVTERVRSPCVGHLLGFWVPVEIRGRSLVRWKALVKAYMPTYFIFWIFFFKK
jgi:hypothetical protein